MINFNEYEYNIGSNFATAMVNGDTSGLNDEDIENLEYFQTNLIEIYSHSHLCLGDISTDFIRCDISGLHDDCIVMTMMVPIV